MIRFGTAALTALVLTFASPAMASPESDAKDLFARGRDLRANGDCGTAAPIFRKAWTIYPTGLGSLRNLAECEEQLGHFASARRSWLDLKRALITMKDDSKYENWDKDAEQAASRLKPKVASFVIEVYVKSSNGEAPASESTGVELFLNGESIGTALVGTPLERDPGSYRIRAQLNGARSVDQNVSVAAGDNPKITIRLVQNETAPTTNANVDLTTPAPPLAKPNDGSTRRAAGWVVTGVGALVAASSGVTYALRGSALSDLDAKCPSHNDCPEDLRGTVEDGKRMSTLTSILLPTGLVLMAVGLVVVFTAPKSKTAAQLMMGQF